MIAGRVVEVVGLRRDPEIIGGVRNDRAGKVGRQARPERRGEQPRRCGDWAQNGGADRMPPCVAAQLNATQFVIGKSALGSIDRVLSEAEAFRDALRPTVLERPVGNVYRRPKCHCAYSLPSTTFRSGFFASSGISSALWIALIS